MRKKLFKWNGMVALVLVLSLTISNLAFAEGTDETIETEETRDGEVVPVDPDDEFDKVNLEEGKYVIKFVEEEADYVYSGAEIKPEVAVYEMKEADSSVDLSDPKVVDELETDELEKVDKDVYTVSYEANINVGTAKVVIEGIEEKGYTGKIEREFEISPKSIENLQKNYFKTCYYTGEPVENGFEMKDGEVVLGLNKDYTIEYTDCIKLGTAKFVVSGIGNYKGTFSGTYAIKVGKCAIEKIECVTYNKLKVTWNKVSGATGYALYRSTSSNGTYKLVKTITSGNTVSYTDTGLTNGKTYYYKIRAFRTESGTKNYGFYSSPVSKRAQVAQAVMSSVKSKSYNSIVVTWNKVSGATGYKIYRSTTEVGGYVGIGYTKTALTFTDTKRATNQTYYYKVRAYRTTGKTRYYGATSAAMSGKAVPAKVAISSSSNYNATTARLVWSAVSGATGYEVYRKAEDEEDYRLVKTLTGRTTTKWNNIVVKGKVYQYKVRAYRVVGGKNVYGSFSSVFTKYKEDWRYVNGYKLYYDGNGKQVKDVSKIIGKQSSYQIKVNRKKCTITVYAKDGDKGYIIPVKAFVCSVGMSVTPTPKGTFHTSNKYRWHTLNGPTYGQYCTRIVGGYLFHSTPQKQPSIYAVNPVSFNKLGSPASHGCVRMTVGDAKWIYDNCPSGTQVTIYDSTTAGPLGKPSIVKIPYTQNWDPTDPAVKK